MTKSLLEQNAAVRTAEYVSTVQKSSSIPNGERVLSNHKTLFRPVRCTAEDGICQGGCSVGGERI